MSQSDLQEVNLDNQQDDGDVLVPEGNGNQQPEDYDHVESNVVKRDDKGNVIKQWTEVVKIIRVNRKKPYIGGYRRVDTNS